MWQYRRSSNASLLFCSRLDHKAVFILTYSSSTQRDGGNALVSRRWNDQTSGNGLVFLRSLATKCDLIMLAVIHKILIFCVTLHYCLNIVLVLMSFALCPVRLLALCFLLFCFCFVMGS